MNKKLLLITLGAGFLTFLVMIATVVFVLPQSPPEVPADLNQMDPSEASQRTSYAEEPAMAQANSLFTEGSPIKRNLSEVQLKSLIFEIRSNIRLFN